MKPDTRFIVAVLALCGALSLAVALAWQFRPPTELVVYTCKSTPPPIPPVQMHAPRLPSCVSETFIYVNSTIPLGLLVTIAGCLGVVLTMLGLQYVPKFVAPTMVRKLSLLTGIAFSCIFTWSAGVWYGQFVLSGPMGRGGGWLVNYARWLLGTSSSSSAEDVSFLFALAVGALLVSRLDGRSVSSALTTVMAWFVLPAVLMCTLVVFLFDYPEVGAWFSGFLEQRLLTSLGGVLLVITNGDILFATVLVSFLLSLRIDFWRV